MAQDLFDIIAINIETRRRRLLATGKTERNAEAVINMAITRRGVNEEFYTMIPAGTFSETSP